MNHRPHQTVVVGGRVPGDPEEYFEVASTDGDTLWCRTWCPIVGTFDDQLVPIPRGDVLRLAKPSDQLPVLQPETADA